MLLHGTEAEGGGRRRDQGHQFALANDDHEEDPINAREYPVFLAAPPGAHQAQLLTVLLEYRVMVVYPTAADNCLVPKAR